MIFDFNNYLIIKGINVDAIPKTEGYTLAELAYKQYNEYCKQEETSKAILIKLVVDDLVESAKQNGYFPIVIWEK